MDTIVLYEEENDMIRRKSEVTALLDHFKSTYRVSMSRAYGVKLNVYPGTAHAATYYFVASSDVKGFARLLGRLDNPQPTIICIEELRERLSKNC
ncbi:MAG: hypothetical protein GY765_11745 [bacterium]|nr:hypothetical protein [bacterium]